MLARVKGSRATFGALDAGSAFVRMRQLQNQRGALRGGPRVPGVSVDVGSILAGGYNRIAARPPLRRENLVDVSSKRGWPDLVFRSPGGRLELDRLL